MFQLIMSTASQLKVLAKKRDGWGIAELLAVIVGIVVVVIILAPGIKTFASDVLTSMESWWSVASAEFFGG